jgi:hypothetical protein
VKHTYSAKDLFTFFCMIMSLVAVSYFRDQPNIPFLLTMAIVAFVAIASLKRRENLPVLAIVIFIKLIEVSLSLLLFEADMLIYFMSAAMLDLILAFVMVHYHNDALLLKLFRVTPPHRHIPQVFLMSWLLALSSLISLALASEVIFFTLDPDFFSGDTPPVYSVAEPLRFVLKLLFDMAIWTLLLNPSHWRLLQKIQLRYRKHL